MDLYHQWLRGHLGDAHTKTLNDIYNKLGGGEAILCLSGKHGYKEAKAVRESYMKRTDLSREQKLAMITEELLAHIGQKNANPGLAQTIREFIGKVRDLLRRWGLTELAEWNDGDIAHLLKTARETSMRGDGTAFLVAYHGSPYDFDKFSTDYGTDAGTQIKKLTPASLEYYRNEKSLEPATTGGLNTPLADVVQSAQDLGKRLLTESVVVKSHGDGFSRSLTGTGMTLRDLEAHIANITKDYKNLPPIIPLQSVDDAPQDVQECRRPLTKAVRAEHVLLNHELGHYGLRGTFGADQ